MARPASKHIWIASLVALGLAVCAVSALASQASLQGQGQGAPVPGDISVIGITDDQRTCLESNPPEICIPSVSLHGGSGGATTVPAGDYGNLLQQHLDELRQDIFADSVQVDPAFSSHGFFADIGVHLGGERLYDDEVLDDPDRRATEQSAKSPGIWVRHTLELRPELNKGRFRLAPTEQPHVKGEVSIGLAYSAIMTLVKRHEMDQVYSQNFWGYTKQDLKLLAQALPLYIRLPLTYRELTYLPGESIAIERFGDISFFVGGNANLIGPPTFGPVALGLQARVGVQISHTTGHFKTSLEMKQYGLARLTLEKASDWSYGPYASIGLNATVGPFSGLTETIGEMGYQRESSNIAILDLVLDLKNPQAASALAQAYSGDFTLAQQVAAAPDAMTAAGVESSTTVKIASHGSHKFFNFLFWGKDSAETRADEVAHTIEASTDSSGNAQQSQSIDEHFQDETFDKKSKGLSDTYQTFVTSRTDLGPVPQGGKAADAPVLGRTLSFEYVSGDSKASAADLLELLRVAQTFVPSTNSSDLQTFRSAIAGQAGNARVRLEVDFGTDAFAAFLATDGNGAFQSWQAWQAAFYQAWADALELPNAGSWATMNDSQRKAAAQTLGDEVKKHYGNAVKFIKNVNKALRKKKTTDQVHAFISAVHGLGEEIYPVGALLKMAGPENVLATFRLSFQQSGGAQPQRTIDFTSLGNKFRLPDATPAAGS